MSPFVVAVVICGSIGASPGGVGGGPPIAPPPRSVPETSERPSLVVQTGPDEFVRGVLFTPDGAKVLTFGDGPTARVWEVGTGRELFRLAHRTGGVSATTFSPDGRRLVTGGGDEAWVWDTGTGRMLFRVVHANRVAAVAFSPDGKRVATGSADGEVKIWDASTGAVVHRLSHDRDAITSVAFSPDGTRLLTKATNTLFDIPKGEERYVASVWDTATGKPVHQMRGYTEAINFSADGKRLLVVAEGNLRERDTETGKEIKGSQRAIGKDTPYALSPDRKQLALGGTDGVVRVYDVGTGTETFALVAHTGAISALLHSPDGTRLVSAGADRTVRVLDLVARKSLMEVRGQVGKSAWIFPHSSAFAFSPDGKRVLIHSGAFSEWTGQIWNIDTARLATTLRGESVDVRSVAISPDGRRMAAGGLGGTVWLWELGTRSDPRFLRGHKNRVDEIAFSPDGRHLLTSSSDGTSRVWDAADGAEISRLMGVGPSSLSPDGKRVATAVANERGGWATVIWDMTTGREEYRVNHAGHVKAVTFSPDGGRFVTAGAETSVWDSKTGMAHQTLKTDKNWGAHIVTFSRDGKELLIVDGKGARVWDPATGQELRQVTWPAGVVGQVAYGGGRVTLSPDGKLAIKDGLIWDVWTGAERHRLRGPAGRTNGLAFSHNNRWLLTPGGRTIRLSDAASGTELCQLVEFLDGSWAVTDPAGRYDASNGGDVNGLHWVVRGETISLNQLKNRYYDPGLLAKVLGFNKTAVRPAAAFTDVKLYPGVAVELPANGTKATVKLTNRGGGIGKVRVLVNGSELLADARGPKPDPDAKEITLAVDLSAAVNLVPGKPNEVEVIAYNAEGYLSSRGLRKVINPGGAANERPPELYAIVCGVSQYADPALNLKFAAKDAEDFAAALRVASERLFGADKVHIAVLTTSDTPGTTAPTKENIKKAFEAAQKARPGDILVVYLAGHGTTLGRGSDLYLYPTRDARTLDGAAFADPAVLAATTVTSAELTDWLLKIGANKKVMVLDTCAAGAAAAKLTEKRDVDGDQVRALDQLKDRTGFHVLMGCAADRVSYEATQFAQGLLTYSLLEGMKGAALQDGGVVDVGKLFAYATNRVPGLAGNVGGVQRPEVIAPRAGQPFAIGRLTAEDQPKVRLAIERPLVLRSSFQEEDELLDVLDLGKKVDSRLRGVSARGRDAGLVFVDAVEFPDAYRLAGRYKVDGDTVTVTVNVFKGKEKVGQVKATGPKAKPEDIADQVGRDVEKLLAGKK